jgi:hypothetical protein
LLLCKNLHLRGGGQCSIYFHQFWMCTKKSKNLADQFLAWHKYSPLRR